MNDITLTDEQILNLIFKKKILIGDFSITSEGSFFSILAKLEERLINGKISHTKNSVLCEHFEYYDSGNRKRIAG